MTVSHADSTFAIRCSVHRGVGHRAAIGSVGRPSIALVVCDCAGCRRARSLAVRSSWPERQRRAGRSFHRNRNRLREHRLIPTVTPGSAVTRLVFSRSKLAASTRFGDLRMFVKFEIDERVDHCFVHATHHLRRHTFRSRPLAPARHHGGTALGCSHRGFVSLVTRSLFDELLAGREELDDLLIDLVDLRADFHDRHQATVAAALPRQDDQPISRS